MATKKRKSVYQQTYKAGARWENIAGIVGFLKQKGIELFLINAGRNDDDSEYVTIKIDGIIIPDNHQL